MLNRILTRRRNKNTLQCILHHNLNPLHLHNYRQTCIFSQTDQDLLCPYIEPLYTVHNVGPTPSPLWTECVASLTDLCPKLLLISHPFRVTRLILGHLVHIFTFFFITGTTLVTSCLLFCTPNPSGKWSTQKRKEFVPKGSKFIPFRVDIFSEVIFQKELLPLKDIIQMYWKFYNQKLKIFR